MLSDGEFALLSIGAVMFIAVIFMIVISIVLDKDDFDDYGT